MSVRPDCPFCLSNKLLKGDVIAENDAGYITEAGGNEGMWLIIPKTHVEAVSDLPDIWWAGFKQLFAQLPAVPQDLNLALNLGRSSGQTVPHLHFWVIPREAGKPSSGKGLATLIRMADGDVDAAE